MLISLSNLSICSKMVNFLFSAYFAIFNIIDTRISFYFCNTHLLPHKTKSSFRHLERGIQDFHMNLVLVQAGEAANNVVVV